MTALLALLVLTQTDPPPGESAARASGPPNIVFVLADDLGWADLGCTSDREPSAFESPRIDRLAEEGVRFTDFYAACPVCSPTRASIQTGQYQSRLRLTDFVPGHWRPFEKLVVPHIAGHLPLEVETPAELLAKGDYVSGYFGKWHLGSWPRMPPNQGYGTAQSYNTHWMPQGKPRDQQRYATHYMGDQAVRFIEDNAAKPFFLFLAPYAVHVPLAAERELVEKYEAKLGGQGGPEGVLPHPVYCAMVEHVDTMVGRVVDSLEQQGLTENTVVIITSDNGGLYKLYTGDGDRVTDNGPLRGEKGQVYEGGIRVPLIVKWPGVAPAGAVCDEPAISIDFWPTFAQIAGVGPDDRTQLIDGVSLVPLLTDPQATLDREAIYWHYPHYHHMDPAGVVRAGDWKYIRHYDGSGDELYDLAADIGEQQNVADRESERLRRMSGLLDAWLTETDSLMPTPNEKADPARAAEWWSRGAGRPLNREGLRGFARPDVR